MFRERDRPRPIPRHPLSRLNFLDSRPIVRRLHVYQLIAKIPRSRRWRVSLNGRRVMVAVLKLHEVASPLRRRRMTAIAFSPLVRFSRALQMR